MLKKWWESTAYKEGWKPLPWDSVYLFAQGNLVFIGETKSIRLEKVRNLIWKQIYLAAMNCYWHHTILLGWLHQGSPPPPRDVNYVAPGLSLTVDLGYTKVRLPLSNTARGLELTLKLHAPFSRIFGRHRWSRIGQQKFGAQSFSEEHLWLIKQHKISKNKSYFLNEVRCLLTFCCTVDATVDRVSMACIISILFFCFLFFASIIQS